MNAIVPPTGAIGSTRPDTRICHMCNSKLRPICGTEFRESGTNSWDSVNCSECIALAADSPQVKALQDMLQNWPAR